MEESSKQDQHEEAGKSEDDGDLNDMLQELRIILQGAQVLTAFLIVIPFNQGFAEIDQLEKWVYLATFLCAISSLIIFSAPAAQHRIDRPLMDRERFKKYASRMIIIGLVPLSFSLILATHLVITQVFDSTFGLITAAIILILVGVTWWLIPLTKKSKGKD